MRSVDSSDVFTEPVCGSGLVEMASSASAATELTRNESVDEKRRHVLLEMAAIRRCGASIKTLDRLVKRMDGSESISYFDCA